MERSASDDVFDRIIGALAALDQEKGLARTLAMGRVVLSELYGGDIAAWRDRRRNKAFSIRHLAEREACPYSRSTLNHAVAIHVASLELPALASLGNIGPSHIISVVRLPARERETLLTAANQARLSVRELRKLSSQPPPAADVERAERETEPASQSKNDTPSANAG